GNTVLFAHGNCGGVHDLEFGRDEIHVAELFVLAGVGVRGRVPVVDAVDLGGLEQLLGADLDRTQGGGGVGREERVPGAGGEDDDAALLQVPDGPQPDVGLGELLHGDRRLDPCSDTEYLHSVAQVEDVEHRRQHPHVVGVGGVHALGGLGHATEDVAHDHDDGDLGPGGGGLGYLRGQPVHRRR